MLNGLAGVEGFFAGMAQAKETDGGDEEEAEFDEKFAAVGPIGGLIFQVRIGEEAVPEKSGGGEIN